ncbi:serine/threonine-protein kinase [Nannocystis sp.]|uniref:serine/threonine-protein kinase n=1 Tax=Nannocystis sp. TaxID=1962667 RepID=UPI002423E2B1|nr:serine/threonine-protein kinase [Nannocystis sp.]MBK7827269.1 serine/threonine protein kinase [Nannocystis sp.]MBK9754681.1 serine/threonine protein kinase [Nannocystis sp.]
MAEILIPFIIFSSIFGSIVALRYLKYAHELKMKQLEQGHGLQRALPPGPELKALEAQRAELEQRIRNLETIVCNVDFELNAKINRLATQSIAAMSAPAGSGSRPAVIEEAGSLASGKMRAGTKVAGRFVIERPLGAGGMGAVYLARDEQLGESVALKVIAGMALLDPGSADRLRREASLARRISHPNVVRMHDLGEEHGLLFVSMEYVAGESLSARIQRLGTLTPAQLRPLVAQLCEGLSAAHAVGIIHRDLKPANVLIDANDRVKLIDFGIARGDLQAGMTATNMIVGTPEYMAPEQVRGGAVDARTDVYALGAVLYHALTGRPPFRGDTPISVGLAHCQDPVTPPRQLRPDIPAVWDSVITRALEKTPSARFPSVQALQAALNTETSEDSEAPTWHGPAPTVRL